MNSFGELEKLMIYAYTSADYSEDPVDEFSVYYNPEEYSKTLNIEYNTAQGDGTTALPGSFRRIKPNELNFKFVFDGTGASGKKIEVHDKVEKFFEVVGYDGEIHRPRYLKIIWGKLESKCVLTKADVNYKMFYPNGKPLRASIECTFLEIRDDRTRVAEADDSSPDLTHFITVKDGDSLPSLCYQIYGDKNYYIKIAEVNKLNNFSKLVTGQTLLFPPVI